VTQLSDHLLKGILILVAALVLLVLLQTARRRVLRTMQSRKHLRHERQQHALTFVEILTWGGAAVIIGAAVLMLLSDFGVNITPLLASAGVAGLAISLGAQTLIKDLIGGFFILVENQYSVGDSIQLGSLTGEVEHFTLRTTTVRDVSGTLHTVPNGEVRIVSNLTRDWSRAIVDVGVAYEEDLDHVLSVVEKTVETLTTDPMWRALLLESPQVTGPWSLGEWAVTIRVTVKTSPESQGVVARELQKRILAGCAREGITLPYPRQEIRVRDQWQRDRSEPQS
jgi:small-conductance mechanosensitive channel